MLPGGAWRGRGAEPPAVDGDCPCAATLDEAATDSTHRSAKTDTVLTKGPFSLGPSLDRKVAGWYGQSSAVERRDSGRSQDTRVLRLLVSGSGRGGEEPMSHLFAPLTLRSVTLANRIVVSPMCQYSSQDGFVNDWHLVHLGSRAVGGPGLILMEATAVTAEGRITLQDVGIYRDDHVPGLARLVSFMHGQGVRAGIQLAHAGRKASTGRPWETMSAIPAADGGWQPIAPTVRPFKDDYAWPRAMTTGDIADVVEAFGRAATRALSAEFDVVELHAAHGYLIHQFLSPLVNDRTDRYGGSFENRVRFGLEVVDAVRAVWPERLPLFVRVSATDWAPGGWDIEESIVFARLLRERGVDLIDCSTGGAVPGVRIPLGPGYQLPFAERIRREAGVATGAVGLITTPEQADAIVRGGQADCILMAREFLRDPYFPLHAAEALGQTVTWPPQYLRAAPPGSESR